MMARGLFFIAPRMYGALLCIARQAVEAVAPEHAVDTPTGDLDTVVPLWVSGDAELPQVVGSTQIENLFFYFSRGA